MTEPFNGYTDRERRMLDELHLIERLLADALGYPYEDNYGWVIGDHTAVTLSMEAANELKAERNARAAERARARASSDPDGTGTDQPGGTATGGSADGEERG